MIYLFNILKTTQNTFIGEGPSLNTLNQLTVIDITTFENEELYGR